MSMPCIVPSVYHLRVVLQGISPLIWRRLLVRSDMSLAALHDTLQIALAWSGVHLYCLLRSFARTEGPNPSYKMVGLGENTWTNGQSEQLASAPAQCDYG
jgi:Plasmid pRiA4b ORF-3-like protein